MFEVKKKKKKKKDIRLSAIIECKEFQNFRIRNLFQNLKHS